ncbi:MAG: hypothetical protein EPN43_04870 [Jatrophihabitans sp.]|nr:MAG: hypothetical protein EPN43_04870 [Jatrophihabitans sp.]
MKSVYRLLVLLVALAAAGLGVATTAGAAPYTNQMTVGVSNSSPSPGQSITVSGTGATPNGQVSIDFHSTVVHLATVTANVDGAYTATVTIPTGQCGAHTIVATDVTTGNTASTAVTLPACTASTGTGTGGGLSATGVAVAGIGAVGVALLLGGGLMLLLGRRRRANV